MRFPVSEEIESCDGMEESAPIVLDVTNYSTIELVKNALARLESGNATQDDVLTCMNLVQRLGQIAKAAKAQYESLAIAYIQANGEIEDGGNRWYVGTEKKTKCLSANGVLEAILSVSGGDLDKVAACLVSNPFKPAATKDLVGDQADALFETTVTPDLKTGKPKKKVVKAFQR